MDNSIIVVRRHRPALGECIAAFAACFPVAFLEPKYDISNRYSIVYQVPTDQVQEHSLEAHGKGATDLYAHWIMLRFVIL